MYRRIELITQFTVGKTENKTLYIKGGLCFIPTTKEVCEAWLDLPLPRKPIRKNCRFYFTEKGWDVYGRAVVKACQKTGQEYRVIRIKEKSVDVVYQDEYQAVARPLKKRG